MTKKFLNLQILLHKELWFKGFSEDYFKYNMNLLFTFSSLSKMFH